MPYQTVSTAKSSKPKQKKLSPSVRAAARASQMNRGRGAHSKKGGKKGKGKKNKVIGHRMERVAPPGGRTTINLGGYGEEGTSSSVDSPSSVDVNVPRYQNGARDYQDAAEGGGRKKKAAPNVARLPLRPKTSAPTRTINFGGEGHEYTAYNPYKTSGNVITVDDLPTEGLMITTPRGVPLKECVKATRREMENAAARFQSSDQTRVGGNAARSARQLRQATAAASDSQSNDTSPQLTSRRNEFGSGARRIQPPGGHSTFKF